MYVWVRSPRRGEEKNKALFFFSLLSRYALVSRFVQNASFASLHKAPVMQAISVWNVWQIRNKSFVTAAVNGTIKCINTDNRFYMELSSSNQSWCCFNFTDSFFKETTAELVKSPASLFHQPLHDRACRHVHSFPSGNLHITEDKQNDLEEYKDDFMDESVARVKAVSYTHLTLPTKRIV